MIEYNFGKIEKFKNAYNTLSEFYAKNLQITLKTVHIPKEARMGSICEKIQIKRNSFNSFNLLSVIGSGGFGTVGKYVNVFDNQLFAIKIIEIKSEFTKVINISKLFYL